MSFLDGIKKAVKKLKPDEVANDSQTRLKKWRDKFVNARTNWDSALFDERELLYNGTHDVDANINTSSTSAEYVNRKKANNVVNIVYELIESSIDTTIPQPAVKSKRPQAQKQAKDIEDSIKNDILELEFARINDENERTTNIQGMSVITVAWNPDFKHQLYSGELQVDNLHPKAFIGQPGVYRLQKMDYFFLMYSMTKGEVKSDYGVSLSKTESEEYPEINVFHDGQAQVTGENDKVTVIVCWYKEDGVTGKFVWCNDTVIEDMPDYYARRLQRCTKCGALKGDTQECQEITVIGYAEDGITPIEMPCGNTKYRESIEETEVLAEDILLADGTTIPAGTEIPYFKPIKYPVVIRRNVPVNFQLSGQSDIDIIRDQADAIKKVVSRLEEKIIRGAGIITALEDHSFNLTNELYQIIRGNPAQLQALGVKSLTDDVFKELAVARYMYESARNTLGITNSWQGKEDTTAKSGIAKQIQVQQSGGRMQSKMFNKYASYAELFQIMFEFKLAYYDELRPYMRRDENGNIDWGEFSKYNFLQQDLAGQYYYNTDFLFESTVSDAFPRDRLWMAQQAKELFQNQAMDQVGLWTVLESLNFPMADVLKSMAVQAKQDAQIQPVLAVLGTLQGLTPEAREAFFSMPPEEQQAMIAQVQ